MSLPWSEGLHRGLYKSCSGADTVGDIHQGQWECSKKARQSSVGFVLQHNMKCQPLPVCNEGKRRVTTGKKKDSWYKLVHRVTGAETPNEEVVALFQGIICKKDLPPFTERLGYVKLLIMKVTGKY